MSGNASVAGTLTVASIEVNSLKITGHILTAGDAPAVAVLAPAITPATNPVTAPATVLIDGNDTAGTITITVNSAAINPGDIIEVTFKNQFGRTPRVIITGQNSISGGVNIFPAEKTATGYKLHAGQALSANSTFVFDYFVIE